MPVIYESFLTWLDEHDFNYEVDELNGAKRIYIFFDNPPGWYVRVSHFDSPNWYVRECGDVYERNPFMLAEYLLKLQEDDE